METEPVVVQQPLCESSRERVFDIPGSILYRVEAVLPNGTTEVFENVRAYADSVTVADNGHVQMNIVSKSDRIRSGRIPWPYHHLHEEEWLCALKIYDMKTMETEHSRTFALNYNLFCLDWRMCVILHEVSDGLMAFLTSREEWERGQLSSRNREVQMFLEVSLERSVPVGLMYPGLCEGVRGWMDAAVTTFRRKR
jgi:hypothetical protein